MYFDAPRSILVSSHLRRRAVSSIFCTLLILLELPGLVFAEQGQRLTITAAAKGKLKLNPDGKKTRLLPFQVDLALTFQQRQLSKIQDLPRWARFYETATANIRINGGRPRKSQLPTNRQVLVAQRRPSQLLVFSPFGPLTRQQLDLVQIPLDPAELAGIAADLPTATSTWEPRTAGEKKHVARLLHLDAINETSLTGKVLTRQGSTLVTKISGNVSGAVRGVATDLDISGQMTWDLNRSALQQATWTVREKRAIGHAEPGFESVTEITMKGRPVELSDDLSAARLDQLPTDYRKAATVLQIQSPHVGTRMLADRNWITMVDRREVQILRLVHRGELTAQCNVSALADLQPGKHLALKSFQNDIRNSLGTQFAQFASASSFVTSQKLRVLRVVVVGRSSNLPIQWNYYHISDAQGRRAALVFTMESKLVKTFAERDRSMIDTFQFLPRRKPTRVNK